MSTTPTNPIVEMQVNGTWVDITADCRLNSADSGGGFEISRGVPNEGAIAEPTQFNFVLNNGPSRSAATAGVTGVYSPMNAAGPYFGMLGRNQRVRVGLDRRKDPFGRTLTAGLGSLPTQFHIDGTAIPGEMYRYYGDADYWSATPGLAQVNGAAGYKMALVDKTYGDADVLVKVKTSTRDSEFGIVLRAANFTMPHGSSIDPTFESGLSTWIPGTTSTLTQDTTIFHDGTASAKITMTTAGTTALLTSPNTVDSLWSGVYPGRAYNVRAWVRASYATTIRVGLSSFTNPIGGASGSTADIAVAANTWTQVNANLVTFTDGAYMKPTFSLIGSPAIGSMMWVDSVEIQDVNNMAWYTAHITPGSPDVIRIAKNSPGTSWTSDTNMPFQIVAGTWYWMRAQIGGQRMRVKMWADGNTEPTAWTRWRTDTYTTAESPVGMTGQVGIFSHNGASVVTFASLQIDQWRAHTEISELPPRWDKSRLDRWVPVQSRGILRRLGQGRKSLKSAVSLHLQSYASNSYGWWPLEDDTGTVAGNNANGPSAPLTGMDFSTPDTSGAFALPGVSGFATLSTDTSAFSATVPVNRTGSGKETFLWFMRLPALPASEITVATLYSTGTVRTWQINVQASGANRILGYSSTGAVLIDKTVGMWSGNADLPTGCWLACTLFLSQNGADMDWAFNHHRPSSPQFFTNHATLTSATVGLYSSIRFLGNSVLTAAGGLEITQVMHYAGDLPFVTSDFAQAAVAYDGETAAFRHIRLGANAGIPVTTNGATDVSTPMGQQSQSKLLDLQDECSEVEDGLLIEDRDDFQLSLVTRASLWNRVLHPLDIDAGHLSAPLEPSSDDQKTRNDVQVSRPNGGFGRSIQTSGPLNISPPEVDPINGVGTYDEQVIINLGTDPLTQQMSDWRRSKGTLPDPRYPSLHTDLTATSYQASVALAAATWSMDAGDVVLITNPEADYIPREQLVTGYDEHIDLYDWDITWTTIPNTARRVGVVSYTTRVDTESQFTNAAFVSGTDTKLTSRLAGAGKSWVTIDAGYTHFPFDVDVSGVRLRVLMVGNVLNTHAGFENGDLSTWQVNAANTTITIDKFNPKKGLNNVRLQTTGSPSFPYLGGMVQTAAARCPVTVGTVYRLTGWLRPEIAPTNLKIGVDWYTSGGAFISSASTATLAATANTWTAYDTTVTAPATAAFGAITIYNTFAGATRLWIDEIRLMPVSSYDGTGGVQTLTVEQTPLNGIVKTVPYNSQIRLAAPWRVGMGILGQ